MAFTSAEKIKILRYLGWPAKTTDPTSLSYSKIVSDRLDTAGEGVEAEAREFLDKILKLEDRLETAISRAGVKSIDDIELSGDELSILRREKRMLIRELGVILDIAILGGGGMPSQGCVVV